MSSIFDRILAMLRSNSSSGSSGSCRKFNNRANQYRSERDRARRNNNWHIRDRNRWRNISNDRQRQINKMKNRSIYFPKNMNPSEMKKFAEDIAYKAGIENVKLKNEQDGHIFTQSIMKKEKEKKLNDLNDIENNLKSQLLLNDRLLMYRSTSRTVLKYIYRILVITIFLVIILYGYKYFTNNLL